MLTQYGKASRKMRIDLGMTMKDLADELGITSSYLSAIEIGKKPLTQDILNKTVKILASNEEEKNNLFNTAAKSIEELNIKLSLKNDEARDIALSFARQFDTLSSEDIESVRLILNKKR